MQNFTDIPSTRTLSDSLAEILNNDKTALSLSSDTTFPTTNLQLGMPCYRTDQQKLYILTQVSPSAVWKLWMDFTGSEGKAPNAEAIDGVGTLGSMSTQNSNAVSITGGSVSGINDLAVADGGTGASTASAARTNLGIVIGQDVQAYSAILQSYQDNGIGFRNRIINGDMRIDQRNAGALITSVANGAYMVDRFQCYHDIGTLNARQNLNSLTPPAGFTNYLGFANTSSSTSASTNYFNFNTSVEGLNWADLGWGTANAQPVTLSFWVRSSIAGTYSIAFNGQNSYGYPATYTINQANTWEFKTITVAGPTAGTWVTDNTRSVSVIWDLGQGSNLRFAAGSWQSGTVQGATGSTNWNQTNGATFYITGVQLEAGSVATPFERRPYGTELALCQRYFAKTFPQTTAVAQNTNESGALDCPINPTAGTAGLLWVQWVYPVIMRASPTITTFNPSAANSNWRNSAGTLDLTASTGQQSDRVVQVRAANVPSGQGAYIHLTASAEL